MKFKTFSTLALVGCLLAGCSNGYKDGSYTGHYEKNGEEMNVTIVIADGKIKDCTMEEFDNTGKLKDETYGEGLDETSSELAHRAYLGFSQYPEKLIEAQSVDDMDAISGATVSFKRFKEAANEALRKAK